MTSDDTKIADAAQVSAPDNMVAKDHGILADDDPWCDECGDSGYIERVSGGFWTGENMRSSLTICDCICGDDVRRQRASLTEQKS